MGDRDPDGSVRAFQEQAEQCAMLIHTKGSYAVKRDLMMC